MERFQPAHSMQWSFSALAHHLAAGTCLIWLDLAVGVSNDCVKLVLAWFGGGHLGTFLNERQKMPGAAKNLVLHGLCLK